MAAQVQSLSLLEQISPQAYTRFVLCFKIDSKSQTEKITSILQQALEATATSIPSLKRVAVPIEDHRGRKRYGTGHEDVKLLTVKNLIGDSWDYDSIRSQGFPALAFDGDVLHRTGIFADPAFQIPVFLAQANFVPGGLLLAISTWHGAFDGTAITHILRLWAQNSHALQEEQENFRAHHISAPECFDKFNLSASSKKATIADHPEFILLPEPPIELPPTATKVLKTEIFYFSPSALTSLKESASPKHASSPQNDYTYTSTNIALSALIWRSIMVATYHSETPPPETQSTFCSPLDARRRTHPPLSEDLIASAWCFQCSHLPMTTLLNPDFNLADTALIIRKSTDGINTAYINSLISMIDSIPNPAQLIPVAFLDVLKTSAMLTSWATFPLYDFNWGNALGEKCERVRTTANGMFNGMAVVLPQLSKEMGGGLEVVIGGDDEVLEALRNDEVWRMYATWK